MSQRRDETIRIQLSSDPRYLRLVRTLVRSVCALAGFDDARAHGVTLAVDEALANVIRHAYGGRTDGEVEITFRLSGVPPARKLTVCVLDRGVPPEPDRVACTAAPDVSLPGGLGLHFIRGVMDTVEFRPCESGGNLLELGVLCPAEAAAARRT